MTACRSAVGLNGYSRVTHRGKKAHEERSRHIRRFQAFYGGLSAATIKGRHLEEFIEHLVKLGYALDYVEKHVVSVKSMFHKGVKKGWLLSSIRPFGGVEPIRKVPKALTEAKLPTDAEVKQLFEAADADAFDQMGDLLRLYHATGARTGELIAATAEDFQRSSRTILLAKHKRSHTLKEAVPRTITLNATAYEILERRTAGLSRDEYIFTRPINKTPYSSLLIGKRYETVWRRAKLRRGITIYSLRHLWISDALMAGVDLLLVARMAGTGVSMIEKVYGHFRSSSYQEAQARLDAARANGAQ